jgi:hypothetical protein
MIVCGSEAVKLSDREASGFSTVGCVFVEWMGFCEFGM